MNLKSTFNQYLQLARLSGLDSLPADTKKKVEKDNMLDTLEHTVVKCKKCPIAADIKNYVFGGGNPHARIMFVGEAPGFEEDKQGKPFVGKAGALLTDIITKGMGLTREDVYITNILKCHPPSNRDPLPEESTNCIGYLQKQIELIRPEVIITLGRIASQTLCSTKTAISKMRGTFRDYNGIPLMPTFHPAYLLRSPSAKKDTWKDIKKVLKKLNMNIPGS